MEEIYDFIEAQLADWELARQNYLSLGKTERKIFQLGDFTCAVQFNPGRLTSTGAKVDARSIQARPCFLCKDNRPKEQITGEATEGWELLVNPYPIFPVHLTFPAKDHDPQLEIPLEMATLAEKWKDLAIFFNGARAGASAPDHAHMQGVLKNELPIIKLTEKLHPATESGIKDSSEFAADLPFRWKSMVVKPDFDGIRTLAQFPTISGEDAETGKPDRTLVNAIMWIDNEGILRGIAIPRRRHRPACYTAEGNSQLTVSPGTIDMAGVIITPRKEDFDRITAEDVKRIYSEVAFI